MAIKQVRKIHEAWVGALVLNACCWAGGQRRGCASHSLQEKQQSWRQISSRKGESLVLVYMVWDFIVWKRKTPCCS